MVGEFLQHRFLRTYYLDQFQLFTVFGIMNDRLLDRPLKQRHFRRVLRPYRCCEHTDIGQDLRFHTVIHIVPFITLRKQLHRVTEDQVRGKQIVPCIAIIIIVKKGFIFYFLKRNIVLTPRLIQTASGSPRMPRPIKCTA